MQYLGKIGLGMCMALTLWACESKYGKSQPLSSYIPQHTQTVLKISHWETAQSDFQKNPLVSKLKDEPFSEAFEKKHGIFKYVNTLDKVLFCTEKDSNGVSQYTFIGKRNSVTFKPDSIPNIQLTQIDFEGKKIQKISQEKNTAYSIEIDSIIAISTSERVLKEILQEKTQREGAFQKAFKVKSDKELTYVRTLENVAVNDTTTYALASHATFELQMLPDGLVGHGVVLDRDSLPELLSIFKGQIAQKNDAPLLIPVTAETAISFGFSSFETFQKGLREFKRDSTLILDPLFETVNEVVQLTMSKGTAIALKSLDNDSSWEALAPYLTEKDPFREVSIYLFSEEKDLFGSFYPLISAPKPSMVFEWEDFLVFTESTALAEDLITAFQNQTVLSQAPYFENASTYLAQASSITYYQLQGKIKGAFPTLLGARASTLPNFPIAITQLIYDRNFAHLNLVAKEASGAKPSTDMVVEIAKITLEKPLVSPPQFFTNHYTLGKDIVAQDLSNVLYFISSNGKVLWKKRLESAILGKVHEVDLFRNGKKQLAFTTEKTLYVLDRNGHEVAPYPKKFQDKITQPLAVFDYDNNRKYRFVVTQGKQVWMYDSKGSTVKGFTFNEASSNIVLPPQHIRMGNKDYIVIAEENGKLNILSRVGKDRVLVHKNFRFSEIPIEKEDGNFVVITKDHSKESISQTGKVVSHDLAVTKSYWFTILGSTKVTLDDHLLRINGKLTELPLGIYSKPQIFSLNREVYVSVTELEEHQIFLFTASGKLISHFPVFGASEIDMADANRNGKLNILVQGEKDAIILYQVQ